MVVLKSQKQRKTAMGPANVKKMQQFKKYSRIEQQQQPIVGRKRTHLKPTNAASSFPNEVVKPARCSPGKSLKVDVHSNSHFPNEADYT